SSYCFSVLRWPAQKRKTGKLGSNRATTIGYKPDSSDERVSRVNNRKIASMSSAPNHNMSQTELAAPTPQASSQKKSTTPWSLLRIWLNVGIQSFRAGAATLYLIRRAAVEQHGWLTDEEFTRYWGICQIAPGI